MYAVIFEFKKSTLLRLRRIIIFNDRWTQSIFMLYCPGQVAVLKGMKTPFGIKRKTQKYYVLGMIINYLKIFAECNEDV